MTANGYRAAGRALGALGLPTVLVQEGGYDLTTIGRPGARDARRGPGGSDACLTPTRSSASGSARTSGAGSRCPSARTSRRRRTGGSRRSPTTSRPRSLTVGADGRTAVFIEDRDTSDLHVLDLDDRRRAPPSGSRPGASSCRTGRTRSRASRPTARPSPTATSGHVWLVPVAGGLPRRLVEGGGPVWLDDARLLVVGRARDRDHAHDPPDRRRTSRTRSRAGSPRTTTTSTRSATRRTRPSPPTAPRSRTSSSRAATSSARRSASSTS